MQSESRACRLRAIKPSRRGLSSFEYGSLLKLGMQGLIEADRMRRSGHHKDAFATLHQENDQLRKMFITDGVRSIGHLPQIARPAVLIGGITPIGQAGKIALPDAVDILHPGE